ncbi:Vicilin-like antimicrobial peptides 2-2 [Apostasia shenzhenica]|uniref:Vicilin-like antimicrobial peptides 2-2 n=1 Tax=Apostasia shenzhenica TaxID=1088818 RepID=A0A2I0A6F4_9ASPA|nr:Vicilin-like antimicrobial peptides 2-2 [Apostasia shenzhenica]
MALRTNLSAAALLFALVVLTACRQQAAAGEGSFWEEEMDGQEGDAAGRGLFILGKFQQVVKTAGGEVKVVRGHRWKGDLNPMHIGFVSMKPNTLFIPQYIDANMILFVRSGKMKVGWMHKDKVVERRLKSGDISLVPAGSTFYIVNTCDQHKLQIIASIEYSQTLTFGSYQSFFVAGGANPASVLAGFDRKTLTAAFNVSGEELAGLWRQTGGPIVFLNHETISRIENSSSNEEEAIDEDDNYENESTADQLREMEEEEEEEEEDGDDEERPWSWRKILKPLMEKVKERRRHRPARSTTKAFNLYNKERDFENSYGWTLAVDEHDYKPLATSGVGVYLVNLSEVTSEYGVVLGGSGEIQVVFPNGSTAMNAAVEEGDVFWIPRYFPFCQLASRGAHMEFFGFTTSARRNRPQFLAGASSVLRSMPAPELAAAFDVSEEELGRVLKAQEEKVILPIGSGEAEEDGGGVGTMKRRMSL